MASGPMSGGFQLKQNRVIAVAAALVIAFFFLYFVRARHSAPTRVRISEVIAASIELTERGGEIVRNVRRGKLQKEIKGKTSVGSDDYVTQGDHQSHTAIVAGLRAKWPNLNFVSEEHDEVTEIGKAPSGHNKEVEAIASNDYVPIDDLVVWIDPLDATQEYTEGEKDPSLLNYVTVMMCVVVKGNPVAGIIHQAFEKHEAGEGVTYWGWVDHGFSSNVGPVVEGAISAADKKNILEETVKVIVSRSHSGPAKVEVDKFFSKSETESAAGAGYKVLQVLKGKSDLYYHSTFIKKWDLCAGDAMLRAAGGQLMTRKKQLLTYEYFTEPLNKDGVLASLANSQWFYEKAKL